MIFMKDERGQGLLEYGMVLVFVAMVIVLILTLLGPQVGKLYSMIVDCFPPGAGCG